MNVANIFRLLSVMMKLLLSVLITQISIISKVTTHLILGNTLQNLGKYKEALECYEKVIQIKPNQKSIYAKKGYKLYNYSSDSGETYEIF